MERFDVYQKGKLIDSVYFLNGFDEEQITGELINQGYPDDIRVEKPE